MTLTRNLCPSCYANTYDYFTLAEDGFGNEGYKCHSCFQTHTLLSWKQMREQCASNEWIQEAYSEKKWNRIMKNIKKRNQ